MHMVTCPCCYTTYVFRAAPTHALHGTEPGVSAGMYHKGACRLSSLSSCCCTHTAYAVIRALCFGAQGASQDFSILILCCIQARPLCCACVSRITKHVCDVGTTIWSPLASGVLSGKYSKGNVPSDSRLALEAYKVPLL